MEIRDLNSDGDIGALTSLLSRVSEAQDPIEVQRAFGKNMKMRTGADAYISVSCRGLERGQYKITRAQFGDEVGGAYANPWANWRSISIHQGGIIGKLIETPTAKLLSDMDVREDPVLGDRLRPYGSAIVTPLFDGGAAVNWGIALSARGRSYSIEEAGDFILLGNLVGGLTRNLLVAKEVRELNARLTSQLEEIAQIQRSLLPPELPRVEGLSLAASYLTSDVAGGDYYDFFDMGSGKWAVVVADVSGHGAGAATVMAMLQTILHGFQERALGPAAMLQHANSALRTKRFESHFVTAFMGVVDGERRRLVYSNAGHNRPELRRWNGGVSEIDGAASVPLGVLDEAEYVEGAVDLQPLDTVVLYTDGITEAMSPPPDREMFGTQRLTQALEACSGEPSCVIDSIHQKLYDFTRSRQRVDDQTIVAMRVEN